MRVRLLLFAVLRDIVAAPELELELPSGATATTAWTTLRERFAALGAYDTPPMFAVNESYVSPTEPLRDGDELALIPPVSGG